MTRTDQMTAAMRTIFAVALALVLAMRLLTPAGFMPAFDHDAVTIVACPDGQANVAPMAAHHGGHSKKLHQPCPYASAAGMGSLAADPAPLIGLVFFAAALLLGRTFLFIERSRTAERPRSRGPPIPA